MDERIRATYRIWSDNVAAVAEAIRIEQTIEFPFDLAEKWIQDEVVGWIESVTDSAQGHSDVEISYDARTVGGELPQLMNVLWGNSSMLPGVRLIDVLIPPSLLDSFKGPRFGIEGLRKMLNAEGRALVGTALKPMGSSPSELAKMAYTIASAGFDTIKDDHSLANQPWALWHDRVDAIATAVKEANAKFGTQCLYAPSLHLPADEVLDAAREAKRLGATALMVLPGIAGFDAMRMVAEADDIALPMMGHPSLLGSFVTPQQHGLAHHVVFGTLMRVAGADISIFPNFGGRFSFTPEECLKITETARKPMAEMKPIWVSPAGGMTLDRISGMLDFYGADTASLVGGALHRGDLEENSRALAERIHQHSFA
jgi:ribulose-bisphosphate carboxylase large chain